MCAEGGTDLDKVEQTMVGSSASGVEQTMVCCRRTTGATDLYILRIYTTFPLHPFAGDVVWRMLTPHTPHPVRREATPRERNNLTIAIYRGEANENEKSQL